MLQHAHIVEHQSQQNTRLVILPLAGVVKKTISIKNKTCPFCDVIEPTHEKCRKCKELMPFNCLKCPKCKSSNGLFAFIFFLIAIVVILVPADEPPAKTPKQIILESIETNRSYNGAYIPLQNFVKKNLKDPKSYEHIKTETYYRYDKEGNLTNTITVNMEYRAKNSFGGYVVEVVSAVADLNGNLVEIL